MDTSRISALAGPVIARSKTALLFIPGVKQLAVLRSDIAGRWFDWKHRVQTAGVIPLSRLKIDSKNAGEGVVYFPTNLRTAADIFATLPPIDFSRYTFVDFGSGKGRLLLLASDRPFRRIVGVEFSSELHAIAAENIRRFRNPRQACVNIESINADAAAFPFPDGDSLFYFCFPFRRPVMDPLMERLDRSLDDHPRDIIIVYANAVLSESIEQMRNMRMIHRGKYFNIYRSVRPDRGAGSNVVI